jgi:hypothetical protein
VTKPNYFQKQSHIRIHYSKYACGKVTFTISQQTNIKSINPSYTIFNSNAYAAAPNTANEMLKLDVTSIVGKELKNKLASLSIHRIIL